jgi:subtilase family serine protease
MIGSRIVAGSTPMEFTVALPLRNEGELDQLIALQGDERSPLYHHFLTPEQFAARFGPTQASFASAMGAMRARGFSVGNVGTQSFEVRGSAAQVESAFGVRLEPAIRRAQARIIVRTPLRLPNELLAQHATVMRLDALPLPQPDSVKIPLNRYSTSGDYWFDDLKQAYHAVSYESLKGTGARIATVGDSDFSSSDAALYFKHEGLFTGTGSLGPAPVPSHILLKGYQPFSASSDTSFEANLDVQQAAGAAPGATVIGVSVDPNNFYGAYAYLIKNNTLDIVSTSYGGCELLYTAAYNGGTDYTSILKSFNAEFKQGNAQGITFVFSSGDSSGLPCPQLAYFTSTTGGSYKETKAVDFWADDPNVTAVGGTNLITSFTKGSLASTYVSESELYDLIGKGDPYSTGNTVSNQIWGSGGGVSTIWPKPSYQNNFTNVAYRSVPDVAMDMGGCLQSSWHCAAGNAPGVGALVVALGGQLDGAGGTSASAPAFAGLLAVKVGASKSRLGNANTYIYGMAAANATNGAFHQGIEGNNGVVAVAKGSVGYNPITGVGTPIDNNFLRYPSITLAGAPQTATNP